MKCPRCDYVAKNPDPMVAKRSLAIHLSKAHGVLGKAAAQVAQEARQRPAGAAIAKPAAQPPVLSYREALEDSAAAGQRLAETSKSTGELLAGLVLFMQGDPKGFANALRVLGWTRDGSTP